ncbi:unnamed protein product [Coccothraustes coccothraustes]
MRRNKHCSRSRRPGGAQGKGLCERQEAIKLHSAAAGSAQAQRSPPITRGGGCGGKGRRPAVPAQRPTPGAVRAGACERAGRRGHLSRPPAPPSWPGSAASVRVWAHAPTDRDAVTCPRLPPSGPPGRAVERPPGARQAPAAATSPYVSAASSRRRRCRTSLATLPSAGRGAHRPAASLGTRTLPPACPRQRPAGAGGGHGRGSTALLGRLEPRPGCRALSSAAISRLTRVRRPRRVPVRALALPA